MNALILNFAGLGDGFIELPFLVGLEQSLPAVRYFHSAGIIFREERLIHMLGLRSLLGLVPDDWRKFRASDWETIIHFIREQKIEVIINLRIVAPDHARDYFSFKSQYAQHLNFWDLSVSTADCANVGIRARLSAMFQSHLAMGETPLVHPLQKAFPARAGRVRGMIGINIHSGSSFKLWPMQKWSALCAELAQNGLTLAIFSGHTDWERDRAAELHAAVRRHSPLAVMMLPATNLCSTLERLHELELIVTTDSWVVHAATALRIDSVGLYLVTAPDVWGGEQEYSWPVVSRHLAECENFDPHLGICRNGYEACRLIVQHGDGIEVVDVVRRVSEVQSLRQRFPGGR
jgi:ADP-heptose:LPS heptosyltransferase